MKEREAIENTYYDVMDSFRRENVIDEISKQTKQTERQILSAVPCALSKNNMKNKIEIGSNYADTEGQYTLFCFPDTDIISGDKIIIRTPQKQEFLCYAGKPFKYLSHAEIPCSEQEKA